MNVDTMGLIQEHDPSHNMDQFTHEDILRDTSPPAATTGYSTAAAICHDIDIEGVVEERVVEGDDELYIQRYPCHILILSYNLS